jgi:ribosomal protein S18 acetylase RimI-like enzyme
MDDVIAFASRNPVSFIDPETFHNSITRLASGPGAVVDLFSGDRRVAVAVVLDRLGQPAHSVLATLIAAHQVPDWGATVDIVLDAAHVLAAAANRRTVTVHWVEPLPTAVAEAFAARDQQLLLREYRMERPSAAPPTLPLPAGWRWEEVDEPRRAPAIALVREAFSGAIIFVPPEDEMRQAMFGGPHQARLLLEGDHPAGFLRVLHDPAQRLGYVGPIARHPHYRGRGLGDLLVAHSLQLLEQTGCGRICLDVTASNARALELYQRHGFTVARQVGYYSRER